MFLAKMTNEQADVYKRQPRSKGQILHHQDAADSIFADAGIPDHLYVHDGQRIKRNHVISKGSAVSSVPQQTLSEML